MTIFACIQRIHPPASSAFWIPLELSRAKQASAKSAMIKIWLEGVCAILKDVWLLIFVILLSTLDMKQLGGLSCGDIDDVVVGWSEFNCVGISTCLLV